MIYNVKLNWIKWDMKELGSNVTDWYFTWIERERAKKIWMRNFYLKLNFIRNILFRLKAFFFLLAFKQVQFWLESNGIFQPNVFFMYGSACGNILQEFFLFSGFVFSEAQWNSRHFFSVDHSGGQPIMVDFPIYYKEPGEHERGGNTRLIAEGQIRKESFG